MRKWRMDENRQKFDEFCKQKGLEPTDRDYFFWLSALQSTHDQQPVAWAVLDHAGVPLSVMDALLPHQKPTPVPLYANPVAKVDKPALDKASVEMVMRNYQDDPVGLALFFHRYYTSK
jgi:hypothetical protein